MKVKIKPECEGQTHPDFGLLSTELEYEVENITADGPFILPTTKKSSKSTKPTEDTPSNGVTHSEEEV